MRLRAARRAGRDRLPRLSRAGPGRGSRSITCSGTSTRRERLVVKAGVDDPDPTLPSAVPLWPGADWMEREVFDMFGIRFSGHPDLRRILMPEEFTAYPLRKDYPLRGRGERHNFPRLTRGNRDRSTSGPARAIIGSTQTGHTSDPRPRTKVDLMPANLLDEPEARNRAPSRPPGPSTSGPSIPPRTRPCG